MEKEKSSVEKKFHKCPKCNSELYDRARRGFFVKKFLFWLPMKRYMCYKCRQKKYVWA